MTDEEKLTNLDNPPDPSAERPADAPATDSEAPEQKPEIPLPPSLQEDLKALNDIDWYKALLIRLQRGQHPDLEINALLARRMPVRPAEVAGPYTLRLLNTLALVFVACALSWVFIWAGASLIGMTTFVRVVSALLVMLLVAVLCIAVFQPIPSLDESKIEELGKQILEKLHKEAYPESAPITHQKGATIVSNEFTDNKTPEEPDSDLGIESESIVPPPPDSEAETTSEDSTTFAEPSLPEKAKSE